jgi:tetratricopeptide (TPR) repeat protein
MERTRHLTLLYVTRDGAPRRHDRPLAAWEVEREREGEGWRVTAPGRMVGLDEYVPDPALVDDWIAERVRPYGACVGPGVYKVESDRLMQAFEASIADHLSRVDPLAPEAERRAGALRDADLLVDLFPDDPLLRLARARLWAEGEHDPAARGREIDRALLVRRDAETLLAASYAHAAARDGDAARSLLREALEREPANETVARALQSSLGFAGLAAEELALDERMAASWARSAWGWRRRAALLEGLDRLTEAEVALDAALGLETSARAPNHILAGILADRGRLRARLGRDEDALSDLDAALATLPAVGTHLVKAELLLRRGRFEESERILRWALASPAHRDAAGALLARLERARPAPGASAAAPPGPASRGPGA